MIIGVPKERKVLEKRVALAPDGAHQLIEHGHKVLIEKGAGEGAHFSDELYRKVGCEVVSSPKDIWTRAELIVKVKEPHISEYQYFREGLVIFDYLHLASMPDVTKALLDGGVTSLGYELVQTSDG
ncbi:MAG: alanine dehydrogenase, partial [Candidatus Dadabacteria bacterium]